MYLLGVQIVDVRRKTGVKPAIQAKRKYVGMGNRSAIDGKLGDCQYIEPIQTLHGCHAPSLAIALRAEEGNVVKLAI